MSSEQVVYQSSSSKDALSGLDYDANMFKISLRSSNEDSSSVPADFRNADISDAEDCKVLCLLWKNGKLGAAYYSQNDSELYVIQDVVDAGPEFMLTRIIFSQVRPKHTVTIGTGTCHFVKAVLDCCRNADSGSSTSSRNSATTSSLPANIQLLKVKEYIYDTCEYAALNLKLPNEPDNCTEYERTIFLNSIMDFTRKMSVHALGALLLFLNKYSGYMVQPNNVNPNRFLSLNVVKIKDMVLIDSDTIVALNIFNPVLRPASHKKTEGFSVYNLLNRCRSLLGQTTLRSIMEHPTHDISVLFKRQDFVYFCLKPCNDALIKSIQENLKYIHGINAILSKIYGTTATLSDWRKLLLTLQNVLAIRDMCNTFAQDAQLIQDFVDSVDQKVFLVTQLISNTIDFDGEAASAKKVTIKIGIDEELDDKKRYKEEIKGKLTLAAQFECKNLPAYVDNCFIVYIPELGYILAVKKWADDAEYQDLEQFGFKYLFALDAMFHYKTPTCVELDKCLGDIYTIICNHETRIILRLCQHVCEHSASLKRPLKLLALFDSFMSMSEVAKELGYVRPLLTEENVIEIIEGRHPLLEVSLQNVVPNDFTSGNQNSHLKIITGPNASGKSIYIKQNALIVYLAHIGSFVPAKYARIGMMSSIHSRIHTNDSISKISTFMTDLRQISEAIYCSSKNSLIMIDEFGKGTAEFDGLAILVASLEMFLMQDEFCPHIVVSTHFLLLTQCIKESILVEHLKFDFKMENDRMVYLYKLAKGLTCSYALKAAQSIKLPEDIVSRSQQVLDLVNTGKSLKHLKQ